MQKIRNYFNKFNDAAQGASKAEFIVALIIMFCLLYTSPSPRDP